MKKVETKVTTTVDVTIGGASVNEVLKDIFDLCHKSLKYSKSKEEECETLFEDREYETVYDKMSDRVSLLEEALSKILDIIEG